MSQIAVEIIRCIKCGQEKTSKKFKGRYDVCTSCSTFESKKFIKAFCFKCHKPIYERTPHIIGMTAEFSEFVCRSCFNSGKYRPRGEINYYKLCKNCGEYFYTYETRQKVCTPKCFFSEKKPSTDPPHLSSKSTSSNTHASQKNEEIMSKPTSFISSTQSRDNTSTLKNIGFTPILKKKSPEGSSK